MAWPLMSPASAHDLATPEALHFLCAFSSPNPPQSDALTLPREAMSAPLHRAHVVAAASAGWEHERHAPGTPIDALDGEELDNHLHTSDSVCSSDAEELVALELRPEQVALAYARQRSMLLLAPHRARVATLDWELVGYDDALGLLEVSFDEPLRIHGGLWEVVLPHHRRVFFDVPAWEIEDLRKRRDSGSLPLRVAFRLRAAEDPRLPICLESEDGRIQVEGDLLVAELLDAVTSDPLFRTDTAVYAAERVRMGECPLRQLQGVPLAVEVPTVEVRGERLSPAEEVGALQVGLETVLTTCYVRGLLQNGRLQGAMVLRAEMSVEGRLQSPEILIDALHNESVRRCVLEEVESMTVPREEGGSRVELRAPLYFRLLEAERP